MVGKLFAAALVGSLVLIGSTGESFAAVKKTPAVKSNVFQLVPKNSGLKSSSTTKSTKTTKLTSSGNITTKPVLVPVRTINTGSGKPSNPPKIILAGTGQAPGILQVPQVRPVSRR
jgi:hypothetical protein